MRRIPLSLRFILGFSIGGFLFSGYLTGVKLFSGACAFGETCPIVLGLPACFYGFALYVTLLTLSILAIRGRYTLKNSLLSLGSVSFVGIVFAGTLTIGELPTYLAKGFAAYTFGVPTCFLGLVFFMLIFVVAALAYAYERQRAN